MAIKDHIKQPIPFYTSDSRKSYNRSVFDSSINNPFVIVDRLKLFPFTLKKTGTGFQSSLTSLLLVNYFTGEQTEIISYLASSQVVTDYTIDTGWITYPATSNLSTPLTIGYYYLIATDGTNTWYSDEFKIGDLTSGDYIKIEYYNTFDMFGDFVYQYGFKNRFIIDAAISQSPEYKSFRKSFKNENQREFDVKFVEDKVYMIMCHVREPLADAINLMKMHDTIIITDRVGDSSEVRIEDITIEPLVNADQQRLIFKFTELDNQKVAIVGNDTNEELVTENRLIVDESGGSITDESGNSIRF